MTSSGTLPLTRRLISVVLAAALVGCSGSGEEGAAGESGEPPVADTTRPPSPDSLTPDDLGTMHRDQVGLLLPWSRNSIRKAAPEGQAPARLSGLMVREKATYDRVVFEFGDQDALPGYRLFFTDAPPDPCGSDETPETTGRAFLKVRFEPARAHDDAGNSTVEQEPIRPRRNLRELPMTCDQDGILEFVLVLGGERDYRILEVSDPARLVVDVGNQLGG